MNKFDLIYPRNSSGCDAAIGSSRIDDSAVSHRRPAVMLVRTYLDGTLGRWAAAAAVYRILLRGERSIEPKDHHSVWNLK